MSHLSYSLISSVVLITPTSIHGQGISEFLPLMFSFFCFKVFGKFLGTWAKWNCCWDLLRQYVIPGYKLTCLDRFSSINYTENLVPFWCNRASCRDFKQRIPKKTNIWGIFIFMCFLFLWYNKQHGNTAFSSHNWIWAYHLFPTQLIPCPSYSFLSVLISFHYLSSPILSSPPCRAVVSLQPPQSSPHRESWRQSKSSPLSPGWVTSNPSPPASLQACGPESWQLREAIVGERLTTHGSYCTKHTHRHKHTHTHTSWHIQSHIFPQHNSYCLTSMKT